jgi:MFS family permease
MWQYGRMKQWVRSRPRLQLFLALTFSVASSIGLFALTRETYEYIDEYTHIVKRADNSILALRVALGYGIGIIFILITIWLRAHVPMHDPGRRLVAVLVGNLVFVILTFIVFIGWSTSIAYIAIAIALVATGIATFWLVPQWQSSHWPATLDAKDRLELEDKARATIGQLLGGLGLVITVAVTLYSVNQSRVAADRTLRITERTASSSRFSRAISQLGARTPQGRRAVEIRLEVVREVVEESGCRTRTWST